MIYMDAASTSFQKPDGVYHAVLHAMKHTAGNAGRGAHAAALGASGILFDARSTLGNFFGAEDSEYVLFKSSVTDAMNTLLHGLLKNGDHVVSSVMEHNSVLRPLEFLRQEGRITYDLLPADAFGTVQLDTLPLLERPNTKAVVLSHVSNLTGSIQPIDEVRAHLRNKEIFVIVDVAQSAGYLPVTLDGLHADALAFTGHKGLLGPQGTGGFVLNPRMNEATRAIFTGGTGSRSLQLTHPDFLPDKFESGTQNTPGIAGLRFGVQHVQSLGFSWIREHQFSLMRQFLDALPSNSHLSVQGPTNPTQRLPVFSLHFKDLDPSMVSYQLEHNYGIITRSGLHCAGKAHSFLGTAHTGTVRVSFGHFTTKKEVSTLIESILELCGDSNE